MTQGANCAWHPVGLAWATGMLGKKCWEGFRLATCVTVPSSATGRGLAPSNHQAIIGFLPTLSISSAWQPESNIAHQGLFGLNIAQIARQIVDSHLPEILIPRHL